MKRSIPLFVLLAVLFAACSSGGEEIVVGAPVAPGAEADAASDDLPDDPGPDAGEAAVPPTRPPADDGVADEPLNGETEPLPEPATNPVEEPVDDAPIGEPVEEEPPRETSDLDEPVEEAMEDPPDAISEVAPPEPEFNGEFRRVQSRDDLIDMRRAQILEMVLLDESNVIVRFESGTPGCDGAQVLVTESDTDVRIELLRGLPPEAMSRGCPAVLELHEIVAPLNAPLGERQLIGEKPGGGSANPAAAELGAYIGISIEDASEIADSQRRPHRVIWKDGEYLPSTDDFSENRLNFSVANGIVIGLTTDAGLQAGDPQ